MKCKKLNLFNRFDVTWFDGIPFGNGYLIDNLSSVENKSPRLNMKKNKSTSYGMKKNFWFNYQIYDSVPASESLMNYISGKQHSHYRRIMTNLYITQKSIEEM